jgi:molybdate transport system regulatory protein
MQNGCGVIQPVVPFHRLAILARARGDIGRRIGNGPLPRFLHLMRFPWGAPWYRIGMAPVSVSFRVDFSPDCAVGPGKIALLERISSTGSLSEAARTLKMSYRRAWLLLEDLNTSFQQPVAQMSVGGRGGGGASLTPFGSELVAAYRALEAQIRKHAGLAFAQTALPATRAAHSRKVSKRRINRPTAAASRAKR